MMLHLLFISVSLITLSRAENRIVGGTEANPAHFPFYASVSWPAKDGKPEETFCGGSIVHPWFVLTAAHCRSPLKEMIIKVNAFWSHHEGVFRNVSKKHVHPGFDRRSLVKDLMLLELDKPVTFDYVEGIAITPPSINYVWKRPEPGTKLIAIGHGITGHDIGKEHLETMKLAEENPLRQVTVTAKGKGICKHWYNKHYMPMKWSVEFCAQARGKDTCQGDSGGPILSGTYPNFTIVGITSWGDGCASRARGSVYARVSFAKHWIARTVCSIEPSCKCTTKWCRNNRACRKKCKDLTPLYKEQCNACKAAFIERSSKQPPQGGWKQPPEGGGKQPPEEGGKQPAHP